MLVLVLVLVLLLVPVLVPVLVFGVRPLAFVICQNMPSLALLRGQKWAVSAI